MNDMTKTCNKCGETKPLTEFHKHPTAADGHRGHCKECQQAIYRAWREANKERRAATVKAWCETNKERKSVADKAWREANPEKCRAGWERMREKWPEKIAARLTVKNAITSGKLVRQPCEVCGNPDVHGHHDDYSRPLEVKWLCPVHHTEHHTRCLY